MKTSILVLLLSALTVTLNAQSKNALIFSKALEKDKKMQKAGTVLTVVGGVTLFAGNIMYWKIHNDYDNLEFPEKKLATSGHIMLGGIGLMAIGIPLWAVGSVKEKHIRLEANLLKFKATTSTYGIGIKMRF